MPCVTPNTIPTFCSRFSLLITITDRISWSFRSNQPPVKYRANLLRVVAEHNQSEQLPYEIVKTTPVNLSLNSPLFNNSKNIKWWQNQRYEYIYNTFFTLNYGQRLNKCAAYIPASVPKTINHISSVCFTVGWNSHLSTIHHTLASHRRFAYDTLSKRNTLIGRRTCAVYETSCLYYEHEITHIPLFWSIV